MQNVYKNLITFMFPVVPKDPCYKAAALGSQTVIQTSPEKESPEQEPECPTQSIITLRRGNKQTLPQEPRG